MAKDKTAYVCSECGYDSVKWLGKCPACGQWDTFREVRLASAAKSRPPSHIALSHGDMGAETAASQVVRLKDVETHAEQRIDTHDAELNRVLGGGLVNGSLVLLGGESGIGKSTLLLQTVLRMQHLRILYVSGEESQNQLKMRADRLLPPDQQGIGGECYILCETSLEKIYEQAMALNPDLLVIDSVQAVSSGQGDAFPGSKLRAIGRAHPYNLVSFYHKTVYPSLKVHLSTTVANALAHVFNNTRQPVGTYVRVGGRQYRGVGAMLTEDAKNSAHITTLGGAGVELAVAERTCAPLPESIVAFWIDGIAARNLGDVLFSRMDIFATFKHNGFQATFYKT